MSIRSHRRLIASLFVVALTVPAGSILLQSLSASNPTETAADWVAGLTQPSLNAAASRIERYPYEYRRAIMRALPAEGRSAAWRRFFDAYVSSHANLEPEAIALINEARALATPESLSRPVPVVQARVRKIGQELRNVLGKEATDELLLRLGPPDGTFASLEPMNLRLARWVHDGLTALAMAPGKCNCNIDAGCGKQPCEAGTGCQVDDEWPACGFLWLDDCNGLCRGRIGG